MNIKSLNNTTILSQVSATPQNAQQTPTAEAEPALKLNRFDRYEGVSAGDGAISLNSEIQYERGIFSENTSAEVGEKILRVNDKFKGYNEEGFSAKHIVSVFFNAEAEDRYGVNFTYEYMEVRGVHH